jgi:hypothetical protein
LGCLFAGLNLLIYLLYEFNAVFRVSIEMPVEEKGDLAYSLGHYLGFNLFLILGIIFLRVAYKANKKLKKRKRQELLDSF